MKTAFKIHNTPLAKEMKARGLKQVFKNGLLTWRNEMDDFVPHPTGYITGPSLQPNNGAPYDFYVSVRLKDGSWAQRSYKNGEESTAKKWALETAMKTLSK